MPDKTDETREEQAQTSLPEQQLKPQALPLRRLTRRRLLISGMVTGAAAFAASCSNPPRQGDPFQGQMPASGAASDTYSFFSASEAAVVEAAVARLIPNDENGPGAFEAGAQFFIDRQLATSDQFYGKQYEMGPFEAGLPTQGDQSALSMRDRYRQGLAAMDAYAQKQYHRGFAQLPSQQQDQVLMDMEAGKADKGLNLMQIQNVSVQLASSGPEAIQAATPDGKTYGLQAFFEILRGHTIAGFWSDPMYGGNRNMVGWKLIGFPGAQIGGYREWILNYGVPFNGPTMNLADYQRRGGMQGMQNMPGMSGTPSGSSAGSPSASPTGTTGGQG